MTGASLGAAFCMQNPRVGPQKVSKFSKRLKIRLKITTQSGREQSIVQNKKWTVRAANRSVTFQKRQIDYLSGGTRLKQTIT